MNNIIGKTLYKAKIRNDNIIIESNTIIRETYKYYYFTKEDDIKRREFKRDVGVTVFLTKKEAIEALINTIETSIKMGKEYIKKEEQYLDIAECLLENENGTEI